MTKKIWPKIVCYPKFLQLLKNFDSNYFCNNKSIKIFFDVWFDPKAGGSIPVGRQFFALLLLSSRRSGGSSLGFRAGSL